MLSLSLDAIYGALFGAVALARRKGVKIGDGCRIYIMRWSSEPYLITIGDRVTVASGTRFITHDGSLWLVRTPAAGRFFRYAPIIVGNDVFIGTNSILLPGVHVGSRVVIGAGSVVTRDVPDDCVVAGNPARIISTFQDFEARRLQSGVSEQELKDASRGHDRVSLAVELAAKRNDGRKPARDS
jgi:acetyltransferase-like isoleucine patch superfamily enzyme